MVALEYDQPGLAYHTTTRLRTSALADSPPVKVGQVKADNISLYSRHPGLKRSPERALTTGGRGLGV
ncbi:hypothetical protein L249_3737 [Ophiocordyceps polyrhachis-furcata BCC 54312]|uniref:Uncharacterized protein n=1 Tax=Ophiocordyceps polyrhachis-furcata BCC 54312 TaxID=1330021 RepID=A0A367L5F2_9HYPO|nr:hypothetical protein L249_3737 [Ophiocordyceps polyrhachis-furcata BCC 54312]